MKVIRTIKVHEAEIVEVQWTLKDESIYVRRYTIPPKATREYSEEAKPDACLE